MSSNTRAQQNSAKVTAILQRSNYTTSSLCSPDRACKNGHGVFLFLDYQHHTTDEYSYTDDVSSQCGLSMCTLVLYKMLHWGSSAACVHSVSLPCCQPATARPKLIARWMLPVITSAIISFINRFQYIPLKTGFDLQMLAPYSSYSAFVSLCGKPVGERAMIVSLAQIHKMEV
jgi:hypothetical protein